MQDAVLARVVPALADVPGIVAIVLGGSRARGTETESSDYDLGLYYAATPQLDVDRLHEAVQAIADAPTEVTPVGAWGRWIVGGAWLSVDGKKVDLLYRSTDAVAAVIQQCRSGHISMDYQPGHPHGFCSAIWMGEVALCRALHDPLGTMAELKSLTSSYPEPLRNALMQRFQWEILFSIENGEIAIARADQTYVAGCAYRALACIAQVLFALNRRYLINEKAALQQAAKFPLTITNLMERVASVWRRIGLSESGAAFTTLHDLERELEALTRAT